MTSVVPDRGQDSANLSSRKSEGCAVSPVIKSDVIVEERDRAKVLLANKDHRRFNMTSDYESSDSPSSSDHSDNVVTSDDLSVSPPKKSMFSAGQVPGPPLPPPKTAHSQRVSLPVGCCASLE